MIGWICFILIVSATICGIVTGNTEAVSEAILSTPADTVTLILKIGGSICLFSGLMRVAEASGLVGRISRFLSRPVERLIPKSRKNTELLNSVTMNLASNFLGLGNAATPYGIKAAKGMAQGEISRSLAAFLILNTCSLQLIPSTICALRQSNGSKNAMDILPAVWIVQFLSCTAGILLTRIFFRREK
ncbi:MAG: spore maturation protein A [Clostridia bacterium]|nr:spore maturation protein A [Clostridia bacterium]